MRIAAVAGAAGALAVALAMSPRRPLDPGAQVELRADHARQTLSVEPGEMVDGVTIEMP